ncbi:MAG: hypothetical protein CMP62_03230 [Flavobacteriales bacterium]|nr:hypothetical protein [Flavobacteriales bacterium]
MKKLLLFAICSIFYCSYAQLPPNSFGEDFTLTDINGNEFNLHSTLDEGKTVILDLFATWCGPCWSYAETGVLEELQEAYPDDVVCVAVEADPSTLESTLTNSDLGDWTSVINYLLMDDPSGDVADDYALAYYPTIYKICPDRMVTEVGQLTSVSAFMGEIGSCTSAQYSKDAKILSYNGDPTYCGGSLESASVTIQNYSIGATLSACDILTKINGSTVDTYPWSGSLSTYQTATVDLGSISNIPDGANISFEIDYSGDMDESNNTLNTSIEGSVSSSNYVSLYIMTDNWGYETSWELLNEWGVIASGSGYGNYEIIEESWELDAGCYTFHVYDEYGDGVEASMWGAYDDGVVTLTDNGGNSTLLDVVQFESQATVAFEITESLGIEDAEEIEVNVFPNPFKEYTNLAIYSPNSEEISVEIYNNLGKVVYNNEVMLIPGSNNIKIESNKLFPGLYYMNVMIDGKNILKPLTILK